MNTRVILNIILTIIILAALAGCIKVEFINPDEAQESEVEVQAPAKTLTGPLPTDEPLPTATPIPSMTSRPTIIPTLEPIITIVPVIALIQEKFDNPTSYYGYDPQIWECKECVDTYKGNNSLRFDFKSAGNFSNIGTNLRWSTVWSLDDIGFLQGRFRLIDVEGGGNPGIFLSLGSVLTKGVWFSSCGINSNSSQLTYQCSIFIDGEDVVEYTTDSIKIEKDDWHTAKMEINPQTKEITFFLDNLIIGQHTPSDKELLNNSNMWILFGVHKGYYQDKIIAEIDDILLARYP